MPAQPFVDQLNEQIANEFAAHQQYVAARVYYDGETLPGWPQFFYAQALEERGHAMMMVQYLLDQGVEAVVPGVAAPQTASATSSSRCARARPGEARHRADQRARRRWRASTATTPASSSCSGSSRSRSRRSPRCPTCSSVVERAQQNPLRAEDWLAREKQRRRGRGPDRPAWPAARLTRTAAGRAGVRAACAKWCETIAMRWRM